MGVSDEWQFQLWPLRVDGSIRSRSLDEWYEATAAPRRTIGPPVDDLSVREGRLPVAEEVLVWEYEGGNLG